MLELVNFNQEKISKATYKERYKDMMERLVLLQQQAHNKKMGVVVLFEGWAGAGKGSCISDVIYKLDARSVQVHVSDQTPLHKVCAYKRSYPASGGYFPRMKEFWQALGPVGVMSFYDRGWLDACVREELVTHQLAHESAANAALVQSGYTLHPYAQVGVPSQDCYTETERLKVHDIQRIQSREAQRSIHDFEAQLVDAGYVVVKFFFHISKKEQKRRLETLAANPQTAWRVTQEELNRVKDYNQLYDMYDDLLERTNFDFSRWTLVNGQDKHAATLTVISTLIKAMEEGLNKVPDAAVATAKAQAEKNSVSAAEMNAHIGTIEPEVVRIANHSEAPTVTEVDLHGEALAAGEKRALGKELAISAGTDVDKLVPASKADAFVDQAYIATKEYYQAQAFEQSLHAPQQSRFVQISKPVSLADTDHTLKLEREVYKRLKKEEQTKLYELELKLFKARRPLILVYEGWDAAGKGGNIKRVAQAIDARGYTVFPSLAPSELELAHPHLWRYWTRLPKAGHVGIYDRSWYGRVLVERVEGFAAPSMWARAYDEINAFELDLAQWGAIIIKFWIDISPEVQLERFKARQLDINKAWKLTAEDWRNRDKYPQYYAAVQDMLRLTSTPWAPWYVLAGDDKLYARVEALKIINETLSFNLEDGPVW